MPKTAEAPTVPADLQKRATAIVRFKLPAKIATQKEYDFVSQVLKRTVDFRNAWTEYWKEPIAKAHQLHKLLTMKRAEGEARAAQLERSARAMLSDFIVAKEAEEARLNREKAEQARIQALLKQEDEAAAAKAMGAPAEIVEAIEKGPAQITAPAPAEAFQRAEGQGSSDKWDGVCDDLQALIVHCAAHPEDSGVLEINQAALRARAVSQKELFNLPGCRAVKGKTVRVG